MSLADVSGTLGIVLTFFGGVLLALVTALLARKKQRADTENVKATTENVQVATDNSVAATGLTVLQAVMLALQQENQGLKAERAELKAQVVELVGQVQTVVDQNGEPYKVQLEHQAGTLTRLRAQLVAVQQENVRLQSLLDEPGQAAAAAGRGVGPGPAGTS